MDQLTSKFHLFDPNSLAEQTSKLDSVDEIWRKLAAYTKINDFEQSKSKGKEKMENWVLNKSYDKNHRRFTYVFSEEGDWDEVKKRRSKLH